MKFCVDMKWLESIISPGLIENIDSDKNLKNEVLQSFLGSSAGETKETINMETLDETLGKELRMNFSNTSARSRDANLIMSLHAIRCHNGLEWLLEETQKIAVQHIVLSIRMQPLVSNYS